VSVPCWWDGSKESLAATIRLTRPDLLLEYASRSDIVPILPNIPEDFFEVSSVPGVGELMFASFIPSSFANIENWWIGEKYDGMRTCWNPLYSILYSRHAKVVDLPKEFKRLFSPVFFDGELWTGRSRFKELVGNVKTLESLVCLPDLRLIVFDNACSYLVQNILPFEYRYKYISDNINAHHPFITIAYRLQCADKTFMETYAALIMEDKGEGVMLRMPLSLYEHGRSHSVLKYKRIRDGEALVVDVNNHFYYCKLPTNSKIFKISNVNRNIKKGDIITYSCLSINHLNVPVKPVFLRKRDDVSWEDVVNSTYI